MAEDDACFIGKYRLAHNLANSRTKWFPDERERSSLVGFGFSGQVAFVILYQRKLFRYHWNNKLIELFIKYE